MPPLPEVTYKLFGIGREPRDHRRPARDSHARRGVNYGHRSLREPRIPGREDYRYSGDGPRPPRNHRESEVRRHTRRHDPRDSTPSGSRGPHFHHRPYPLRTHMLERVLELTDKDPSLPSYLCEFYGNRVIVHHASVTDHTKNAYRPEILVKYLRSHNGWPPGYANGKGFLVWKSDDGFLLAVQRADHFRRAVDGWPPGRAPRDTRRTTRQREGGTSAERRHHLILELSDQDVSLPWFYFDGSICVNDASTSDVQDALVLDDLYFSVRNNKWPRHAHGGEGYRKGYLMWRTEDGHLLAVQRARDFSRALYHLDHPRRVRRHSGR